MRVTAKYWKIGICLFCMFCFPCLEALINEQCGDGIMSAIDFYLDVGTTVTGSQGKNTRMGSWRENVLPVELAKLALSF